MEEKNYRKIKQSRYLLQPKKNLKESLFRLQNWTTRDVECDVMIKQAFTQ